MRNNVGDVDSAIRMMVGIVLLPAAAATMESVLVSIGLIVAAMTLLFTAFTEWCPLYAWLGINTRGNNGRISGGPARHRRA